MAKGWDAIQQQAEAQAAARQRMNETRLPELRVNQNNPGPVVVRFLEQGTDINNFPVHEYKEPGTDGRFFNRNFTCLSEIGQDCPGCRAGMKQKRRGVYNVIQRNRAVYRKDAEGKTMRDPGGNPYIDGYADTVVIANVGSLTAEMLRQADGQYQGLMARDFVVGFSGNTFQAWSMNPHVDQQGNAMATPMSDADRQLAANKYNLDLYMKPPTPQEAQQIIQRFGANSGARQQAPQQSGPAPQQQPQAAYVDPSAMAAAGMNSFGLATGLAQPPVPATAAVAPQQPQPVQAQPPQQTYQPTPIGVQAPPPQQPQQVQQPQPPQLQPPVQQASLPLPPQWTPPPAPPQQHQPQPPAPPAQQFS